MIGLKKIRKLCLNAHLNALLSEKPFLSTFLLCSGKNRFYSSIPNLEKKNKNPSSEKTPVFAEYVPKVFPQIPVRPFMEPQV